MYAMNEFDSFEEPLRGGPYYYKTESKKSKSFQGPKRAIRLCILCIVLPGLLIGVPLYLKHHVFAYQMYPVGISDMRIIDGKVSTTWCQRQIVRANTTFNAFLLPELPNVANNRIHVNMVRHLELSDDMKEYWGFYLLKGSIVTVSTCARWPGSSMILIRGHKHLQQCAYIGDDSSEELEELLEIAEEKGIADLHFSSPESPANRVDLLTKHRPGVEFHDDRLRENKESFTFSPLQELAKDSEDNISGKRMKELLGLLPRKANKFKTNIIYNNTHGGNHVDRLKNQLKAEIENREKLNKTGATGKQMPSKLNIKEFIKLHQADHIHKVRETNIGNHETENVQITQKIQNDNQSTTKEKSILAKEEDNVNATSDEILEDLLKQLDKLGQVKRNRILQRLKGPVPNNDDVKETNTAPTLEKVPTVKPTSDAEPIQDEVEILEMHEPKLGTYKRKRKNKTTVSPITSSSSEPMPESTTFSPQELTKDQLRRLKRQLDLENELTADADEGEDLGIEQGYVPDGIADHHHVLNQTNLNDRSNSEFWSSFSSSEEALLNCAGLILSLPLTPNGKCHNAAGENDFDKASQSNKITYTVPVNGYYFFIFNSENEVQDNYIRVKFDIQKTVYNVSSSIQSCNNATSECRLSLNFFSNEKVVFELPMSANESLYNEEYIVVSECEPRTSIYLICVLSVPSIILLFAFQ
ncbi:uncharacterized protein LOC116352550 [Contarinia nasturtii]|uniref:uncharacterized protein LOC116352550 n=1 Tax=Contarinia nasturtii TaxID=265458 RepID=UPI0012D46DC0|nr:uncharacterized protein LOC116352550 [Contarinia nasturtii]XP_031641100.1 uncharacterized protein LOC116352550 [Contarinia nasturtii]XP_031641101.1 uncharacterized protein LOC116352550 [Contarinia nasturtii]XP_031641102.1 uncharacterized protein LOC116352550 [Contarinia nasturtii]